MNRRSYLLALCFVFGQFPRTSIGADQTLDRSTLLPYMEHPTGAFTNATSAMQDAVVRLRSLKQWPGWITFRAQGVGKSPNGYAFAEIRMQNDTIDVGSKPLAVENIVKSAGVSTGALVLKGQLYSVAAASPAEIARLLDAIFRNHFGIRPFPDEGNDYAVGAEW